MVQLRGGCFADEPGICALDVVVDYKIEALRPHQDHPLDYSLADLLSSSFSL